MLKNRADALISKTYAKISLKYAKKYKDISKKGANKA